MSVVCSSHPAVGRRHAPPQALADALLLPVAPDARHIFQNLRSLIEDCWAADPESRPSFEDVVNRLEDMLKDMPKHSPYSKGNDGCQCSLQ